MGFVSSRVHKDNGRNLVMLSEVVRIDSAASLSFMNIQTYFHAVIR